MRTSNEVLLDGYSAGSFVTAPVLLKNMIGAGFQITFSGATPTGTLSIQESSDNGENGPAPAIWTDVTAPVTSVTSITSIGTTTINISNRFSKWLRVKYTASAGASTVHVVVNLKGL